MSRESERERERAKRTNPSIQPKKNKKKNKKENHTAAPNCQSLLSPSLTPSVQHSRRDSAHYMQNCYRAALLHFFSARSAEQNPSAAAVVAAAARYVQRPAGPMIGRRHATGAIFPRLRNSPGTRVYNTDSAGWPPPLQQERPSLCYMHVYAKTAAAANCCV